MVSTAETLPPLATPTPPETALRSRDTARVASKTRGKVPLILGGLVALGVMLGPQFEIVKNAEGTRADTAGALAANNNIASRNINASQRHGETPGPFALFELKEHSGTNEYNVKDEGVSNGKTIKLIESNGKFYILENPYSVFYFWNEEKGARDEFHNGICDADQPKDDREDDAVAGTKMAALTR